MSEHDPGWFDDWGKYLYPKWTRQQSLPNRDDYRCFALSSLSPNALIAIPYRIPKNFHQTIGIYRFDIAQNEWTRVIDFGKGNAPFRSAAHCMFAIDQCDGFDPIFFMLGKKKILYRIDLNTNTKLKMLTTKMNAHFNVSAMLCINGELHVIVTYTRMARLRYYWEKYRTDHLLFDEQANGFKLMHSWKNRKLRNIQLIYLKHRRSMLLYTRNNEWEFPNHTRNLYEFSLASNCWSIINTSIPENLRTPVSIRNGEYLAFLGVDTMWLRCGIVIFDFETKTFRDSTVKLPNEYDDETVFDAVCVNGCAYKNLTAGFIRTRFKEPLPQCLVTMIGNFAGYDDSGCDEFIHVIARHGSSHFKIKVDDILDTVIHKQNEKKAKIKINSPKKEKVCDKKKEMKSKCSVM